MVLGRMNIHKRILVMLLSVGLLTFAALGLVSLRGLFGVRQQTEEGSEHLGNAVADFAEDLAVAQTKKQISETAAEKARQVERELTMVREDTEYLANAMTRILTHQEEYLPKTLPTPFDRKIANDEAYLLVTDKVRPECETEEVLKEIALASNIADDLEVMATFYADYQVTVYYGSRHGYLLNADNIPSDEVYNQLHSDFYHHEFDLRIRPWYTAAVKARKSVFTEVYMGNDGFPMISCAVPCYDAEGLAGVAGIDIHLQTMYQMIADRSLGTSNINFALNNKGELMYSSEVEGPLAVGDGHRDLRKTSEQRLALEAASMVAGLSDVALVTLDGEEYYLAYAPMPSVGWSVGTLLKRDEVLGPAAAARESLSGHAKAFHDAMRSLFLKNAAIITALLLAIFAVLVYGSRKMAERFVQPILALTGGVREIAKGDLDQKIDVSTGDEIEELADSVNHMTGELKEYMANLSKVTADKEKIATELSLAQGIQEGMLPNIFPKFVGNPHYDLFATMHAAKEVGGDFYDFYNLDEDHVALTIADVSGKGIPASLFMVISKTMLKNDALASAMEKGAANVNWGRNLEWANRQLCENNEEMMFVTVFFGVMNIKTGEFVYANGGHNAPLLGRVTDGKTDWQYIRDEKKTHMVGAIEDAKYEMKQLTLHPGDMLYFYTDGVTEAMNAEKELYTEERLQETLNRVGTTDTSVKEILAKVRADIDAYANGADQSDDITMLGIRFLG